MTLYVVTDVEWDKDLISEIDLAQETLHSTLESAKLEKSDRENEMTDDEWEDLYIYMLEVTEVKE